LRKRLDSSGDGFSDRDLREFGRNPQTVPLPIRAEVIRVETKECE
jgi:hypothetical protein